MPARWVGVFVSVVALLSFGSAAAQQRPNYVDMDVVELVNCILQKSAQLKQTPVLMRDVDFFVDEAGGKVFLLGTPEQKAERQVRYLAALELCKPSGGTKK